MSLLGKWGFSLPEMLVVVAVLGILAAISIPVISGLIPSSEISVAQRNLNLVNGALHNFKQAYWTIPTNGTEENIFRSLQYRDPVNPLPGTPFLPATANFVSSSSDQTYRAYWNGVVFRMYPKGASGTGFDLLKISESTNAYVSPSTGPAVGAP
ncbi:MAG: type II secretion system protein [Terrimicrobiaceae bacterium]